MPDEAKISLMVSTGCGNDKRNSSSAHRFSLAFFNHAISFQPSSLREEVPGEADKWRQRRNLSFDQNRHLEEVTKER